MALFWALTAIDVWLVPHAFNMYRNSSMVAHGVITHRIMYMLMVHTSAVKHLRRFFTIAQLYDISLALSTFLHFSLLIGVINTTLLHVFMWITQRIFRFDRFHVFGMRDHSKPAFQGNPFRERGTSSNNY